MFFCRSAVLLAAYYKAYFAVYFEKNIIFV